MVFATISGFEKLRAWLPQLLIDYVDPHATIGSVLVRETVADAISFTLVALFLLLALSILGRLRDTVGGRRAHRRTSRFWSFVRKLSMLFVLGLPWWSVWGLIDLGEPEPAAIGLALMAAAVWMLAVVVDHAHVWHAVREQTIVLRQGFAIFRTAYVEIDLSRALIWSHSGKRLGEDLMNLSGRRRRVSKVHLTREAWKVLSEGMGEQAARLWLKRVLLFSYRLNYSERGQHLASQ